MENKKVIAEVEVRPDATPEELQAIKDILRRSGLLLEEDGHEIIIFQKEADGQHY